MDISKYTMRVTDTHVYFHGGPFSNWFKSNFRAELPILRADENGSGQRIVRSGREMTFSSGEKYMMASKASVFGDTQPGGILEQIMGSAVLFGRSDVDSSDFLSPMHDVAKIKALGRKVHGMKGGAWDKDDIDLWDRVSYPVVTIGNLCKFSQNAELSQLMLEMGDRRYVEGSDKDKIWGVLLKWSDPRIEDEANWLGENRLGRVHDTVSEILRDYGTEFDAWQVLSRHLKRKISRETHTSTFTP